MRALVVEDDRSWQQVLSEILADVGLSVEQADDLEMALAHLRAQPHRLAVIDLALGGGDYDNQDGLRVLEAARQVDPGCITILLTGFATVELAVAALNDYGAFTCLRKEVFDRREFQETVRHALSNAPALPREERTAARVAQPESSLHSTAAGSPGLVLLTEDDAGWRSILAELLSDAGFKVQACASYGEALGCLRRGQYALAVVDLSLTPLLQRHEGGSGQGAELDGYHLLAGVRAQHIPTIVVSGTASPADIERVYAEYGVFACLSKQTFDRHLFVQTARQACASAHSKDGLDALTEREREVLNLLAQGLTNKEIADALVITTNTVKRHLKAIFAKLDVHTRAAAAARALGRIAVTAL